MAYTKNANTVKVDAYQQVTDTVIAMLEQGNIPWEQPWRNVRPMSVNGHIYRGMNFFLLSLVGMKYADYRYLTFNKALDLGGNVRKGEKSYPVILWNWVKRENKDTHEEETFPFIKVYRVFNALQCENITFPALKEDTLDFVPSEKAEEVIANMPNRPITFTSNDVAGYCPKTDELFMPPRERFVSEELYYSSYFHELAHSTGHAKRLNRRVERTMSTEHLNYSFEELVAEMTSAFCMSACGMNSDTSVTHSAGYVQSWIKAFSNDPKMLVQAAGKAQKAADYILGVTKEEGADTV